MKFDFIEHKESENIIPFKLTGKEQYYHDLMNIEHSWTGGVDVLFLNEFFRESVQLIVNSIVLFEQGYFDCAFYSLRQSMEISTTTVYFADDTDEKRTKEFRRWKSEERFPMYSQMIKELERRENTYADMISKMSLYFEEVELAKQKSNKYVHKQGFDKFYVSRAGMYRDYFKDSTIVSDFENLLIKSIGAVAVLRLAIDPLPLLLNDDQIYIRTGQFMAEAYSDDFLDKYIGHNHIQTYKKTELYKSYYFYFIDKEEMSPSVLEIVKNEYVDINKVEEIFLQKHLLSDHDLVAVALMVYSKKIAKIYCFGGLKWYITDIQSKRLKRKWSSHDFLVFKSTAVKYNIEYDEAFLSHINITGEDYYIEHNEKLTAAEIDEIENTVPFERWLSR